MKHVNTKIELTTSVEGIVSEFIRLMSRSLAIVSKTAIRRRVVS